MMFVLTTLWSVLAMMVIFLASYRKWAARQEDDSIHLGQTGMIAAKKQAVLGPTLDRVDRWGKLLTAIAVVYGLGLLARFLYMGWLDSNQIK